MEKAGRQTARALVVHGNALLLMERWRSDPATGKERHYFSIPGGAIEPGETPESAVVRELYEEMRVIVRPHHLAKKQQTGGSRNFYFVCRYLSGVPKLAAGSPEAKKQTNANRFKPVWVSREHFDSINLYPTYEPLRAMIKELFDGHEPD